MGEGRLRMGIPNSMVGTAGVTHSKEDMADTRLSKGMGEEDTVPLRDGTVVWGQVGLRRWEWAGDYWEGLCWRRVWVGTMVEGIMEEMTMEAGTEEGILVGAMVGEEIRFLHGWYDWRGTVAGRKGLIGR